MSQTRKGNQWYFGMKAHIGADVQSGLVHTVTGTTAKDSDHSHLRLVCLAKSNLHWQIVVITKTVEHGKTWKWKMESPLSQLTKNLLTGI